jgi:nucleoside-diphosphate-sugar epimerase
MPNPTIPNLWLTAVEDSMKRKAVTMQSVEQLEKLLSEPTPGVVESLGRLDGDLLILGAGGKMGPGLARMARRAFDESGKKGRVMAASRFSSGETASQLRAWGVEVIPCDLLDDDALGRLPDAPNVVYMAGMKFGTTGNEPRTWALNAFLPGIVCRKYRRSRIAAFSSGNVYGLAGVDSGGSKESDTPNPTGEYAWSVLGRERIFQHFSLAMGLPVTLLRLNYACELRYGVLVDIARRIAEGLPVSLSMGWFNTLWQRDANAMALRSLAYAESPARILNLTGPEALGVRDVAERLAGLMGLAVTFEGRESSQALLNDAREAFRLFGRPTVGADILIAWVADWVKAGGASLGKPTHFESVDGRF